MAGLSFVTNRRNILRLGLSGLGAVSAASLPGCRSSQSGGGFLADGFAKTVLASREPLRFTASSFTAAQRAAAMPILTVLADGCGKINELTMGSRHPESQLGGITPGREFDPRQLEHVMTRTAHDLLSIPAIAHSPHLGADRDFTSLIGSTIPAVLAEYGYAALPNTLPYFGGAGHGISFVAGLEVWEVDHLETVTHSMPWVAPGTANIVWMGEGAVVEGDRFPSMLDPSSEAGKAAFGNIYLRARQMAETTQVARRFSENLVSEFRHFLQSIGASGESDGDAIRSLLNLYQSRKITDEHLMAYSAGRLAERALPNFTLEADQAVSVAHEWGHVGEERDPEFLKNVLPITDDVAAAWPLFMNVTIRAEVNGYIAQLWEAPNKALALLHILNVMTIAPPAAPHKFAAGWVIWHLAELASRQPEAFGMIIASREIPATRQALIQLHRIAGRKEALQSLLPHLDGLNRAGYGKEILFKEVADKFAAAIKGSTGNSEGGWSPAAIAGALGTGGAVLLGGTAWAISRRRKEQKRAQASRELQHELGALSIRRSDQLWKKINPLDPEGTPTVAKLRDIFELLKQGHAKKGGGTAALAEAWLLKYAALASDPQVREAIHAEIARIKLPAQ